MIYFESFDLKGNLQLHNFKYSSFFKIFSAPYIVLTISRCENKLNKLN